MHEGQPMIGDAPAFRRVVKAAQVVAATDANVLLLGETGTGKGVLARVIHAKSRRAERPFLELRCAGLSESDLDRELVRGGADAEGATLFLDEVAELSLASQARLLRFLETRGAGRGDGLRVIAASARDLWAAVESGELRRDLYYRLYVVPLELPPLRERAQDIGPLLAHYLRSAALGHGLEPPRLSATAERQLRRYAWPGNVRELVNFCERMVILFAGCDIGSENLPWEIRRGDGGSEALVGFRVPASGVNLRELEIDVIRQALALSGGNKSRAARLLSLSRDTLLYRMQKYLIQA